MIPFNKPHVSGKETLYISDAIQRGKIAGDGHYTVKCQELLEDKYDFKKVLLTTSCTDALEMAAILLDIKADDEIIAPSYTFVSTVNAFVLRGAKISFADSYHDHPNIDPASIEQRITPKTKAIVVVHYAGVACDMDRIMAISDEYNIPVIEDAAQAINGYYKEKPLGSIGTFGTFSFHETKNIICGEGGMLVINDEKYIRRAEIIREKGTNRASFFRGEVAKYNWVDLGSSFLPSDIVAAYLFAQLENLDRIQIRRNTIWQSYSEQLNELTKVNIELPKLFDYSTNNAHIFYLICVSIDQRTSLIQYLKNNGVNAVFHYLSLHKSEFYREKYNGGDLPNSDKFADNLVRLPLFYDLSDQEVELICLKLKAFFQLS